MPIYDLTYDPAAAETPGTLVFQEIARWNDGGYNTAGQAVFQIGASKDFVITTPSVAASNAPAWITADGGSIAQAGTFRLAIFANGTTTTPLASLTGALEKPWNGIGHTPAIGTLRLDDPNTAADGFDTPYADMSNAFGVVVVPLANIANLNVPACAIDPPSAVIQAGAFDAATLGVVITKSLEAPIWNTACPAVL